MTTATLIPLHTQTFINELLLEEREPLVSVKHTWVLLMSPLSTHTVVSLCQLLGIVLPRDSNPHFLNTMEESHCCSALGENILMAENITLTVPLVQLHLSCSSKKNKKHLLLLWGHYASLLLGLNRSLSQFDF